MDVALFLLLLLNVPIYRMIFKYLFESREQFLECLRYLLIPNVISLFRGEYGKDYLSGLRVIVFLVVCGIITFFEYSVIAHITGINLYQ